MATVYSLVCWGGSAGKSVTVSSSTDYVTLTNHGLRNATGVAFTSGTLPTVAGTALALNTTYYAKSISSSTFELYYDSSLTSKIDFTSTGSSLVMKSAYYLGLSDKSRWTTAGVERIYDGIASWVSSRASAAMTDEETCELGEAFIEYRGAALSISVPSGKNVVTSLVNGVRSGAFHAGVISAAGVPDGFIFDGNTTLGGSSLITLNRYGTVLDGFSVRQSSTYGIAAEVRFGAASCEVKNCILLGYSATEPGSGVVHVNAVVSRLTNNLIMYGLYGVNVSNYMYGSVVANNIVTRSGTGIYGVTYLYGYYFNNISVGNSTANWTGTTTYIEGASNNAGLSGEAWITGSSPRYTIATTDFTNYANHDYSPLAITSPQVEQGTIFYDSPSIGLDGMARPAYPGSAYNTAVAAGSFVAGLSYTIASVGTTDFTAIGASANTVGVTFKATGAGTGTGTATLNAKIDIGAYEFDLGYGAWPATFTLTIDNVVVGSSIQLEESDGTLIEFRTADSTSEVFDVSASLGVITVKIRKGSSGTKYQPYETQTTAFDGSASIYVSQVADTIAA